MSTSNLNNHVCEENGTKPFCFEDKFANLPPSREILDFYRNQIKSLEDDSIATNNKLAEYKLLCDDYHDALMTISNYKSEVHGLQNALSDLQECLFQEKDINNKLRMELQASKLCQSSNKRHNTGQKKQQVTSHRSCKQKENVDVHMRNNFFQDDDDDDGIRSHSFAYEGDENLNFEVQSLRKQLNEQSSAFEAKLNRVLKEERKHVKCLEKQRKEDKEMIDMLINKLKRVQDMLHDNTKELIELGKTRHEEAVGWMEEKEKLMQEVKFSRKEATNIARKTLTVVEQKLKDAEKWNDLMKSKLQKLDGALTNRKEEYEAKNKHLEESLEQTTSCLSILSKRYKDLEVRKKLEIEGYKTDINQLKAKLEIVEAQCYKIVMSYCKDLGLCYDDGGDDGIDRYDQQDSDRKEIGVKFPRKVVHSRSSVKSGKSLKMKSYKSTSKRH